MRAVTSILVLSLCTFTLANDLLKLYYREAEIGDKCSIIENEPNAIRGLAAFIAQRNPEVLQSACFFRCFLTKMGYMVSGFDDDELYPNEKVKEGQEYFKWETIKSDLLHKYNHEGEVNEAVEKCKLTATEKYISNSKDRCEMTRETVECLYRHLNAAFKPNEKRIKEEQNFYSSLTCSVRFDLKRKDAVDIFYKRVIEEDHHCVPKCYLNTLGYVKNDVMDWDKYVKKESVSLGAEKSEAVHEACKEVTKNEEDGYCGYGLRLLKCIFTAEGEMIPTAL